MQPDAENVRTMAMGLTATKDNETIAILDSIVQASKSFG